MKRISLSELIKNQKAASYPEQYAYVMECIEKEKVRPVKNSPLNGKSPALHMTYWVLEEKKDYSDLLEEITYRLPTAISPDYYYKHPEVYEKEGKWVRQLGRYLDTRSGKQDESHPWETEENRISLNERSFQIWGQEKFLQRGQGKTVLKHCGVSMGRLNIYETSEPLSYYSASREIPQTILIIENKDTFYSMRKFLIENPGMAIMGQPVRTLVYGAGKGILRSVDDFRFCVEPYMNHRSNQYLYFGDLDYEGIGIYERLAELFEADHEILPFAEAYDKMLEKAVLCEKQQIELPDTKEGQNRSLSGRFFSCFPEEKVQEMKSILECERYIPQEILNITDLMTDTTFSK